MMGSHKTYLIGQQEDKTMVVGGKGLTFYKNFYKLFESGVVLFLELVQLKSGYVQTILRGTCAAPVATPLVLSFLRSSSGSLPYLIVPVVWQVFIKSQASRTFRALFASFTASLEEARLIVISAMARSNCVLQQARSCGVRASMQALRRWVTVNIRSKCGRWFIKSQGWC